MAINDIEELALTGTMGSQVVVNTYHFRVTVAVPDTGLTYEQMLIDAWQASCQTPYLNFHTSLYTLNTVSARQVCGALPLRARIDESVNQAGNGLTPATPAAAWLSLLVRERTGFAGRSYQGRNFYPIGDETYFQDTAVASAKLTLINNYNGALMAAFGPSGTSTSFRLFTFSRKLAAQPGRQCQDAGANVIALSTSPYLTTTRSRRSRTGA